MNPPQERVKIFQEWQWNMPRHYPYSEDFQSDRRERSVQGRRAQELIADAQLLLTNILYFNESRDIYARRAQECLQRTGVQLDRLHLLCSDSREDESAHVNLGELFYEHLQQLYLELRGAKLLQQEMESYFKRANLANYDRRTVRIQFTKSALEVRHELEGRVTRIKERMHNLREAVCLLEGRMTLSSIFGREYTFDSCLEGLAAEIGHKSLIEIHYLMLFQLEEVETMVGALTRSNSVSEGEYLKYEVVYDCLCLMGNEIEEMQGQRGELEQSQRGLMDMRVGGVVGEDGRGVDAFSLMSVSPAKINEVERNIRIYEANLQNFKRVNAQIDMYLYSLRRAQFLRALTEFETFYEVWKGRQEQIRYLFERYHSFLDLRNQTEVDGAVSERGRKSMVVLHAECLAYDTQVRGQERSKQIEEYQEKVVLAMQEFMSRWRLPFNNHRLNRLSDVYERTRKERGFFGEIAGKEPSRQIEFIRQSADEIKIYRYEVQGLLAAVREIESRERLGKSEEISELLGLRAALRYCSVIASVEREGSWYAKELAELEKAYGEQQRCSPLPAGFDSLFFNYVNDLGILSQCELQRVSLDRRQLEERLREVMRNRSKMQIDRIVEDCFEEVAGQWRSIYCEYLREVSVYGRSQMLEQIGRWAEDILDTISAIVPANPKLIDQRKMQIGKSEFYCYGIQFQLRELLRSPLCRKELLRIVNIDQILTFVFGHLDRSFISRSVSQKVSDLLKLRLLETFFAGVYGERQGEYAESIRSIRYMVFLETMVEVQIARMDRAESQQGIQLSVLLHSQLAMAELTEGISKVGSQALEKETAKLLKEIRQYPLTIAAKHDIAGLQSAFRYEAVIKRLRGIGGSLTLADIAAVFVGLTLLTQIEKITATKYELYENMVVRRRKTMSLTFEGVSFALRPKIVAILSELDAIQTSFREGESSAQLLAHVQALSNRAVL